MTAPTCATCPWFQATADSGSGECRKGPPVGTFHPDGQTPSAAVWPQIPDPADPWSWCGEHPERRHPQHAVTHTDLAAILEAVGRALEDSSAEGASECRAWADQLLMQADVSGEAQR